MFFSFAYTHGKGIAHIYKVVGAILFQFFFHLAIFWEIRTLHNNNRKKNFKSLSAARVRRIAYSLAGVSNLLAALGGRIVERRTDSALEIF